MPGWIVRRQRGTRSPASDFMMSDPLNRWPEIKRLAEEEIGTLLWNGDPPELTQTLARLEASGYSKERAMELIERAWLKTCLERDRFDRERFVALLNELT